MFFWRKQRNISDQSAVDEESLIIKEWATSEKKPRRRSTPPRGSAISISMRSLTCVVLLVASLGWRMYMEDAHIASVPFTDKRFGLFGVFDGHGGTLPFMKVPSAPYLWAGISPKN